MAVTIRALLYEWVPCSSQVVDHYVPVRSTCGKLQRVTYSPFTCKSPECFMHVWRKREILDWTTPGTNMDITSERSHAEDPGTYRGYFSVSGNGVLCYHEAEIDMRRRKSRPV